MKKIFPGKDPTALRESISLLEAYFACDGSLTAAAESLFIHKNTFQYRLRRLAEETGLDVRRPGDAPSLYLAMLFFQDLENEDLDLEQSHK